MFQLVSSDDLGRRLVFPLVKVKTTIGRDATCDIVLDDAEVSRQHAKVYIIDGKVQVKDMISTNGTFLNNNKIEKMMEVATGDQIIVGPNMFCLELVGELDKEGVALTCMLTVDQLRELADQPIPERPRSKVVDQPEQTESTMLSSRKDLLAEIYEKKIGVAKFPSVEIIFGRDSGRKYLLPPGKYSIGRSETCNIQLKDEKVSSVHASFTVGGDGVTFNDEESLNGSILNNKSVSKAKLRHRDTLMIGETKIRFLDPNNADNGKVNSHHNSSVNSAKSSPDEPSKSIEFMKKYWIHILFAATVVGGGIAVILSL